MYEAVITLENTAGQTMTESKILAFRCVKDVYQPYSTLSASLVTYRPSFGTVRRIRLSLGNTVVHDGLADTVKLEKKNGQRFLSLTSRGFTSMLCQNELTSGLIPNISLDRLMQSYYTFPAQIQWESNTDTSNYIYVKENDSMWDGIANLCFKLNGRYPYIGSTNTVRLNPPASPRNYTFSDAAVLSEGQTQDFTALISQYHMADADGTEDAFQRFSGKTTALHIIRNKQIAFDMQYLRNPPDALKFRMMFSNRSWKSRFITFFGYREGLELNDRFSYGADLTNCTVSRIEVTGTQKGTITKISAYFDDWNNVDG